MRIDCSRGHQQDADWLDAHTRSQYSDTFATATFAHGIYAACHKDPRLKALRDSNANAEEVLQYTQLGNWSLFRKHGMDDPVPSSSSFHTTPPVAEPDRVIVRKYEANFSKGLGSPITVPRSIKEFEQLAAEGTANIRDVRLFLRNSRAAFETLDISREELRRRMVAEKAGGKILSWFWNHMEDSMQSSDIDIHLAKLLTWHLHGEGLEGYVWAWLSQISTRIKSSCWSSHLLAGLIKAQIEWESIDSALETFYARSPTMKSNVRAAHAMVILSGALQKANGPPCSPAAFEHHLKRQSDR